MASETVVIGLNWVGDNILALPTYRALQHRFRTEGGIAIAVPENIGALMASTGISRQIITWSRPTRARVAALREGRFRRAIILPNSFRSSLIPALAGIRERWGYAGNFRWPLLTNPVAQPVAPRHQLDDYGALLAAISAPRVVGEVPTLT
ncbi:MAG: glycosyltransferase family 9 protein, partial [Thermoanaerobaculia bacterium]